MMNPAISRKTATAARAATFYILVTGIAAMILLPVFFLCSISLMSDSEAYNEWPLPLIPSISTRFTIESTNKGYLVCIYNRAEHAYVPLVESADPEYISTFLSRKTNCRLTVEELNRRISKLSQQEKTFFRLRKRLLANYITFFSVTDNALPAVLRSIKTALATILISLVIGGMGGYAFARYSFSGKSSLRLGVLFVRVFPGVAVAMPMVIILGHMGLYDRPLGLALVYAVGQIALTVWITASIFMSIPVEMEEAAQVFGTTKAGSFFRITLPMALPGLAACAMYAFIGSWNETIQAIVLTQDNPTFPVVVYQTLVGSKGMVNLAAAGAVTMALPAVVFTLIIRRYVLRMWGGVKV
jgi:multiple sugar transport system permease protein